METSADDETAKPREEPSEVSTPRQNKRKRVVLSIQHKQQVLQRLDQGETPLSLAKEYNISRQQVSDLKKNRERIFQFCLEAQHPSTLQRKTIQSSYSPHPAIEHHVYQWLILQRTLANEVTGQTLADKVTEIFLQFADDQAKVTSNRVADWVRKFRLAHNIRSLATEDLQHLPVDFTSVMEPKGLLDHRMYEGEPATDLSKSVDIASNLMPASNSFFDSLAENTSDCVEGSSDRTGKMKVIPKGHLIQERILSTLDHFIQNFHEETEARFSTLETRLAQLQRAIEERECTRV